MSAPTYEDLRKAIVNYATEWAALKVPPPANQPINTESVQRAVDAHLNLLSLGKQLINIPTDARTNY